MNPREHLVTLAQRTVRHAVAGTVPLADEIMRVPASHYVDEQRWHDEMHLIFGRVPLVLGMSSELATPHSWKALEVGSTPLLITRDESGVVRLFINSCSHRGAQIRPVGHGVDRRHVCPYHAWNYDSTGALVGILDRDEFGDVDPSCHGLMAMPVAERAGLIFGLADPDATLDLDSWLCGYGEMLDFLGLSDATHVGSQTVDGPNWKIAYDGYLDFYHLPVLHRDTFGPSVSNKAIYDAWGPHQRVSAPDRQMMRLASRPSETWTDTDLTTGVWTIFPHVSIARFDVRLEGVEGGGPVSMVSMLYPGTTPTTSVTVQHFLASFDVTDELVPALKAQMDFLLRVVRDEDYATGIRQHEALAAHANREVLFGRNELGGQQFHRWIDRIVDATTTDDLAAALDQADARFQDLTHEV